MTDDTSLNPNSLARRALIVAVVAGVLAVVAGAADLDLMLRAYLVGYLYWLGITLGCFAMLLLHNLTGGNWGLAVRPWAKAGAATLPLMALLFIPLALGVDRLFEWANPEHVAHDRILQHKEPYLNVPFFYIRAVIYFVVWIGFWLLTQAQHRKLLRTGDPAVGRRMRLVSGQGIAFYGVTITFASVDWLMSLEPHWFSAIYGVMILVGQGLAGLVFVVSMSILLPRRGWNVPLPTTNQLHDLGKLTFAFVMLWGYMSFMQFLIMWYGNLPEEVTWYEKRLGNGWQFIAGALVVLHFFVPFFLLLARQMKRSPRTLLRITLLLLVMRWVDVWWLAEPAFGGSLYLPWRDLLVTAVIGGLWIGTFAWAVPQGEEVSRRATHGTVS